MIARSICQARPPLSEVTESVEPATADSDALRRLEGVQFELDKKSVISNRSHMADSFSVSSPRRILSLSKKRRASVTFHDTNEKASGFGLSGEHGPKPAEVYGFVGSITTVVATVIFLMWAYVPESWLHYVGIFYYPSRYWALAAPSYFMVMVVLVLVFYIGLNFMSTPPPTSLTVMFDEYSREPQSFSSGMDEDRPIDPISDIGITRINDIMFRDTK
ncbi:hypothetical protein Nepgr_020815 [Nepenthes gracilis]|uniref:PIG-P domain-containing protein n=1 Tax=Nepenthes gracilis TaxID=150966 RepID=A0AAD3XWG5_NEPGR|nr:hypothetical protein Nepgr_020815 [Nepenthes gracilis]